MDGQTLHHCMIFSGCFFFFLLWGQDNNLMWSEAKLLPFLSWVPAENVNLRLSYGNRFPHLSESRRRLRKAWQQIDDALPVPPHQTFRLFCHFFHFKTLTKFNSNLFYRNGPIATAASCSVHVRASCWSFACSSIRCRFIHLDSQSLYYLREWIN